MWKHRYRVYVQYMRVKVLYKAESTNEKQITQKINMNTIAKNEKKHIN